MSFLTLEFIPSHNRSLFVVPIKHFVPLEGRGVSTVRAFDSFLLVNFVPHDNTYDTLQIVNLATSNYFPGFAVLSVTTLATLPASHSRSCRVSGESMAWKKTIVTFVITNLVCCAGLSQESRQTRELRQKIRVESNLVVLTVIVKDDSGRLDCITMSAPSTVHFGCMTTIGSEGRSRT
jgi:hypothetical protein